MKGQDEHSRTRAIAAHSLTGSLWWLLPPVAALFYPQAVRALYESGKLLHRASGPVYVLALLAIVVSVGLIYGVPALSFGVAYQLGEAKAPLPWNCSLVAWRT